MMKKIAVCVISGGMDSALAAKIAQNDAYEIIALHFSYAQRTEKKELECFRKIANSLGIDKRYELSLPFFRQISTSALIDKDASIPISGLGDSVPITYVPFRNGIFLSIATALAEKYQAEALFIGVVEEDSSGYPDCRESYIKQMQKAINLGTKDQTNIEIKMPLVLKSKSEIVLKSIELGVALENTWSCYKDEEMACGICDSCRLRLRAFKDAGLSDPIPYR